MSRPIYKPIEADEAIKHIKAGHSKNVYIDCSGDLIRSDREQIHIEYMFKMSWYVKCEQEEHIYIAIKPPVRPEVRM